MVELEIKNLKQTKLVAKFLAETVKPVLIKEKKLLLILRGELGSGKTTFAQIFGRSLGVKGKIKSPTFILWQIYPFKLKGQTFRFNHLDLYRLKNRAEVKSLVGPDLIQAGDIFLIEWGEKLTGRVKAPRFNLDFKMIGPSQRLISIDYAKK